MGCISGLREREQKWAERESKTGQEGGSEDATQSEEGMEGKKVQRTMKRKENELGGRGRGVVSTDVFWADEGVQYS